MKNGLTITVERLQRGQPRPYADHTYRSRITIDTPKPWGGLTEGQVRDLVKLVVHPYRTDEELAAIAAEHGGASAHFTPKLTECRREVERTPLTADPAGPHREVWIAEVRDPYTD
jgi:hypothetical protein